MLSCLCGARVLGLRANGCASVKAILKVRMKARIGVGEGIMWIVCNEALQKKRKVVMLSGTYGHS